MNGKSLSAPPMTAHTGTSLILSKFLPATPLISTIMCTVIFRIIITYITFIKISSTSTDKGAERLDQYQFIPPMKGEDFGEYRHNLSLKEALSTCKHRGYKTIKLGFSHYYLNADCIWPGGYEQPSYYRSNNRVFKEDFKKELFNAELDGPGLMLDPRYISEEMLEVIEGLENYPIIDEDDHSSLEIEDQGEAWEHTYRNDFISAIKKLFYLYR